jgi:hypothetical protein
MSVNVVRCPHHVGEREPGLLEDTRDGGEAVARLLLDAVRHGHGRVVVAGGAGHERELAVDDRTAVAGNRFERRAAGDQTPSHVALPFLNVCSA